MSDALDRAERYRELAEEYRRLAATSCSIKTRDRYSRMAKDYILLADVEEQGASSAPRTVRAKDPRAVATHPLRTGAPRTLPKHETSK